MSQLHLALSSALLLSCALAPTLAKAGSVSEVYVNNTDQPQTDFHFRVIITTGAYTPPISTPWGAGTATLDESVPGEMIFDVDYSGPAIAPGGRLAFHGQESKRLQSHFQTFDDFAWTPSGKTPNAVPLPSALPLFFTAIAGVAAISWSRARRKFA